MCHVYFFTSGNVFFISHFNVAQWNASKEVRQWWDVALRHPAESSRFKGAYDAWFKSDCAAFCNDSMMSVQSCWYSVIWWDVNLLILAQYHDQHHPGKLETRRFERTEEEPAESRGQCMVQHQCYRREEEPCRIIVFTIELLGIDLCVARS